MELSQFFLQTPISISFFALFCASTIASIILFIAVNKKDIQHNRKATTLLALSFAFLSLLFLLLFLEESFFITWNMFFLNWESFSAALFLIFALQFSYHYPSFDEKDQLEKRIVLGLSVVYAFFELWLTLIRTLQLLDGLVRFRPIYADYPLMLGLVWIFVVLIRRTIRESRKQSNKSGIFHILIPKGRTAATIFSFAILIVIGLLLVALELIGANVLLPYLLQRGLMSLGLFLLIGAFLSTYINYFPETVSVRVRLLMLAIFTNLTVLSTVAWGLLVPFFSIPVTPVMDLSRSSLKVMPGSPSGYEVINQTFNYDEGESVLVEDWPLEIELPFSFPFYGEEYDSMFIHRDGAVSFDNPINRIDLSYNYGREPAIYTLHYQSVFSGLDGVRESGIFYRISASQVVITWKGSADYFNPERENTFQLILYPNGSFDINFKDVIAQPEKIFNLPHRLTWFTGFTNGDLNSRSIIVDILPAKSTRTRGNGAFLFDINFAVEKKLNPFYSAFIPSIFFSSLAIFLLFPSVMEKNLVAPLTKMITGIEKIKRGDLEVELSPVYDDEIGKISSKLNEILSGFKNNDDKKISSLDQLSSAFEDNPTATMILASNLKIEFVNSAFCDLTGYSSDEVINDTPKTIEGGDLFSNLYQKMWLSVFKNKIWRGELKKRHKDGRELWVYSVIKPIENNEGNVSHIVWMMEDFTERKQTEERLIKLSTIDSLTNVSNRRHLFTLSRKAFDYSTRYGNPFSILLMDIDHFKTINDTYGHLIGDEVLRQLAHLVSQNIRDADIFGRYGGEEFMITMPNTSLRQAKLAAENLRKLIAGHEITLQEIKLNTTVSIGISEWEVKKEAFQDIINRADQALYIAKNTGRNRVAG